MQPDSELEIAALPGVPVMIVNDVIWSGEEDVCGYGYLCVQIAVCVCVCAHAYIFVGEDTSPERIESHFMLVGRGDCRKCGGQWTPVSVHTNITVFIFCLSKRLLSPYPHPLLINPTSITPISQNRGQTVIIVQPFPFKPIQLLLDIDITGINTTEYM